MEEQESRHTENNKLQTHQVQDLVMTLDKNGHNQKCNICTT